jgi:acyl-CoA synthetase (AMP-forming)/AMP-acid ligase II
MEFNLADLLESIADAIPDQEAIICGDTRLTYKELDERATRLAHYFLNNGIGKGDHIGVYLYNSTEYLEATLAAFKVRAVPININYRYVEEELEYLFDNADLVALVHHREFAPRIAAVSTRVPGIRLMLYVDDDSNADVTALGSKPYAEALAASPTARDFAPRSADDMYILYTGGTTGMPKGVMWRHEDLLFAALNGGQVTPGAEQPSTPEQVAENAKNSGVITSLSAAPLMHGAAQWASLIFLLSGNRLVLCATKRFDPEVIWRLIEQEKVNTLSIVGDAMARPLAEALDTTKHDVSSLFVIGSGGATFSEGVKAQLKEKLPNIGLIDTFGGSEGGNQGHGVEAKEGAQGPRFEPKSHTAVLDEDNRPLPPGTGKVGMLARRGHIPLGYYKDPEKTARTFVEAHGERWVVAGDMAMVEDDGSITLLGRGSVCINSGGEKVFPEEVEAALRSHPDVFDALVVGVPDERWGERVAAVVHPRDGTTLTLENLDAHCRTKVAGYKVPRELHIVSEIQRQPSGKPDYKWAKSVATAALAEGVRS